MTRVDFYHLQTWPLEKALPPLLEKVRSAGHRAVLLAGSSARVEAIAALLWTYAPDCWLPHGSTVDGQAALQPIWLTTLDENPNKADVLVLTDGMDSAHKAKYWRCLDLFDGHDSAAVASARDRWRACRAAGFVLFYWQQTEPSGGWKLSGPNE
ncbi:DNA polymerase III chi subunit [invertebrate metagenome]|uniref:DNA polymerase III chi subunit n=1 Tax=invertebrate metagenome TaxID=1711999 RepID=A0A484H7F2_9ZZZZ